MVRFIHVILHANQSLLIMKYLLKLAVILSIVIAFTLNTHGQQQFGVKVSGGISRIYGSLESHNRPPSTTTTTFSPSFQAGLWYNFPMGKKSAMGAELLYSQVSGGQKVNWDYKKYLISPYIEGYGSDFTF